MSMSELQQNQKQQSKMAEHQRINDQQVHTNELQHPNTFKNIFDNDDEYKNEQQNMANQKDQNQFISSHQKQHQIQNEQVKVVKIQIQDSQNNIHIQKQQEKINKQQNMRQNQDIRKQIIVQNDKNQNQNQFQNEQIQIMNQYSKQHYNNQRNMSIDLTDKNYESNSEKASSKGQINQQPFLWGQQEEQHNQPLQKTYTHLYLNINLANDFEKFGSHILENAKTQSQIDKTNIMEAASAPIVKINKKNPTDSYDIWVDLKKSMELKPRSLAKKKKIQQKQLIKSNSSHLLKNQIKKNKQSNHKIQKYDNSKNMLNPQAYNSISIISKQISGKVKEWMQQQKSIEIRRHRKIIKQKQKQQMMEAKQLQIQSKKKKAQIKLRVRQISQRLQAKKIRAKLAEKEWATVKITKKNQKSKQLNQKSKSQKVIKKIKIKEQQKLPQVAQPPAFSMHWNRKDSSQLEKEKAARRKFFDEKIKDKPIKINIQKKIELLIKADKELNPSKYQILSKKGLSDYEIYQSYKQFKIMSDPKKVGKRYLQQLRSKYEQNDLQRYMSNHRSKSIQNLHQFQKSLQI